MGTKNLKHERGGDYQVTTERELELSHEVERLRLAMKVSQAGAWDWDLIANESVCDERFYAMYGIPADAQPLHEIWLNRIHTDCRDRLVARINRMVKTPDDDKWHEEIHIVFPDGQHRWVEEYGLVRRDKAGKAIRFSGIAIDITERKEREEELRRSEERYRRLHESMRDPFVYVAMDGRILDFNDLYCEMLGYSPEEIKTLTYRDITPEQWHVFEEVIVREQIIARGYSDVYEKEYRRKCGTVFPIELRTILRRDSAGTPIGMWAIVREITERKRAENALKESEERLREVLENSLAASYKRDLKKNSYEYLSPVISRVTGYAAEEMNSFSLDDLFGLIHPEDRESVKDSVINSQRDGTSQARQIRYRFKSKEGEYRWLLDQFSILKDERQQNTALIGSVSEITALKIAEDELKRLNDSLENRIQRRTANLVEANKALESRTHQLRQLAGELTMAEQRERKRLSRILHDGLQQYLVAAKFQTEGIIDGSVKEPVKQVASGIYSMLAESLRVARSLSAELSPPILHEAGLFSGLEWLSRWMFEKHRLKVQLAMDIDNPVLPEELKVLLFESVREMLLNVVKHAGTNIAKVHLIQAQDNHLQITVSDNGSGFDLTRLASISNGDYGFGLFSIRERMELTGGKFEADSSPGNGTRFTLTVPLGKAEPIEAVAKKHEERGMVRHSSPSSVETKIRILLADDHAVMREGLARLLGQEEDFDVIGQASDGSEAIERAAALHPDVILMDVSMPNLNGIEATRIIYQRHPEIRIIGLSLYSEEERAREMLEAGATFYMTKSGPASELKAAVRACTDANPTTKDMVFKDLS